MDIENDLLAAKRVRVYSSGYKAPFYVYVRASKEEPLKHVKISKHIFTKYAGLVSKVSQMNNHKLRVEFSTAAAANDLARTNDPVFDSHRVYIPSEQVEVEGIVHLSVDDCEADLMDYGRGQFGDPTLPEVSVIDVFRFTRPNRDGEQTVSGRLPTSLVRVTFPGSLLPRRVIVDGLLLSVEPYKRKAMFCENCLPIGHSQKYCVVKPKCARCSSEHDTKAC